AAAEADRRSRRRGSAQCRQVDLARGRQPRQAQDRRLSVHDAGANLGVVEIDNTSFVMADIPGLIEGAHEGQGLGHRFLGHIERSRVLVHLIDATQEDIVGAYKTIRAELKAYGGGLAKKTEILVLNKIDALTPDVIEARAQELQAAARKKPLLISGVSHAGVDALLRRCAKVLASADARETEEHPAEAWRP